ncbi:MAG: ATP-binding cassette domain-containing protein [Candidatus Izimaplasma sp.]|nr:ATP-binding cassette domain-containing protein [Candidatus Izimaplasma bacterium]
MEKKPLLEVRNLKKFFDKTKGLFAREKKYLHAVDDISFTIYEGETFGLVGESGCGKSTTGRTIVKLYEPTDGQIIFDGVDLASIPEKDMLPYRRKIQMIFQDPYASLNARMTVTDIIAEGIVTHKLFKDHDDPEKAIQERIYELLESVGLKKEHASRYPHEFSGGQRQRIGIARALAVNPKLIICDEPISALDVSIQAQVVNMLEDFQDDFGLTYLFIAHDLSMVKYISDRIGVMYLGKLMEVATSDVLYDRPLHPYTKALLSSIPLPDPEHEDKGKRIVLQGDVPSPINPKDRCRFATRCNYSKILVKNDDDDFRDKIVGKFARETVIDHDQHRAVVEENKYITEEIADGIIEFGVKELYINRAKCFSKEPELKEYEKEHFVACHFTEEIDKGTLE